MSDVIRQVVEDGDPIIVEQRGTPQVAVISLADLKRLHGPTPLDHNGPSSAPTHTTKADWWDEFERELHDLSVE